MNKHAFRSRIVQHAATAPFPFGALKTVAAIFTAAIVFVVSTGGFLYADLAGQVRDSALDISGLGAQSGGKEPLPADEFEGRALNILVVGTDSREGTNAELGAGDTSDVEGLRGDVTMVIHVSADRSRLQVVSIPRDLLTTIPACTRTDGSVSGETWGMFNTAMSIGANWGYDVASGIACAKSTVEYMTGMTIDAFAVVDFAGFIGMVDALDGVWFQIDEAVSDAYSGLALDAGCQKLDGTQALAYARARYDVGDGTDLSRIGRQQQLVSAMLRELLAKNYVTDFPALIAFLQAAIGSLQVSSNLSDVTADAGLLLTMMNIDRANIQFVTLPNYYSTIEEGRVEALEPLATELWEALIADAELPVGIQYTDGNGAVQTVLSEEEKQAAAAAAQSAGTTGTDAQTPEPEDSAPAAQTCPAE